MNSQTPSEAKTMNLSSEPTSKAITSRNDKIRKNQTHN